MAIYFSSIGIGLRRRLTLLSDLTILSLQIGTLTVTLSNIRTSIRRRFDANVNLRKSNILNTRRKLSRTIDKDMRLALLKRRNGTITRSLLKRGFVLSLFRDGNLTLRKTTSNKVHDYYIYDDLKDKYDNLVLYKNLILVRRRKRYRKNRGESRRAGYDPRSILTIVQIGRRNRTDRAKTRNGRYLSLRRTGRRATSRTKNRGKRRSLLILRNGAMRDELNSTRRTKSTDKSHNDTRIFILNLRDGTRTNATLESIIYREDERMRRFGAEIEGEDGYMKSRDLVRTRKSRRKRRNDRRDGNRPTRHIMRDRSRNNRRDASIMTRESRSSRYRERTGTRTRRKRGRRTSNLKTPLINPLFGGKRRGSNRSNQRRLTTMDSILRLSTRRMDATLNDRRDKGTKISRNDDRDRERRLITIRLNYDNRNSRSKRMMRDYVYRTSRRLVNSVSTTRRTRDTRRRRRDLRGTYAYGNKSRQLRSTSRMIRGGTTSLFFTLKNDKDYDLAYIRNTRLRRLVMRFSSVITSSRLALQTTKGGARGANDLFRNYDVHLKNIYRDRTRTNKTILSLRGILLTTGRARRIKNDLLMILRFILLCLIYNNVFLPPNQDKRGGGSPAR